MQTKVIKINPINPEKSKIKIAARIIQRGETVAFPTETVYGLGADALNDKAVKKIFKAKGRPIDNPLIIHIADKKEVYTLAKKVPKEAEILIENFWPGPLTIIFKKSQIIPKITTAGLDTIAIRMPANKIALSLIKEAKMPIAAPSANLSGKPSPTCAQHVIDDLYGKINILINGGETDIGIESSVIDLTAKVPTLLRPGRVTIEELRKVLKEVLVYKTPNKAKLKKITPKSPGTKYNHYAPNAHVILVKGNFQKTVKKKIIKLISMYNTMGKKVGVMTVHKNNNYDSDLVNYIGSKNTIIAKNLFKTFRYFDKNNIDIILAEGIKEKNFGFAIMNRLEKASSKIIK